MGEPGYFRTIIVGTDRDGLPLADQPGAPGGKTFVRVTYNMPVIAPIVSSIAPVIRFEAESVVTNETQGGSLSQEGVLPPSLDIEEFQEDPDDGIDDDWEYTYFGSPGAYDETGDPDGDGCDNECEYNHPANALFPDGLDPTNPDTDADDLPDGWEIDNGLDPLDPNPPVGRDDDPDGDTFSNYDEYLADTNPMDINDFPGVFNASMTLTPLGIEQGAGDIVVDVSVTDDTATPIAGLNPATDFTWTITPDPGVGGPIFNTYDGDSYLFDMPAGIYPPDAYDIELTVDDGTSDETMNEAFAVIPPGSCDVTPDANFTYAADTITWGMDNDGFQDVTVRQVTVVWPDGAAELDQLDSVKWQRGANPLLDIWTGSADTSPTDFGDSTANTWNQPNDRDLSPTETGQIELHFTQPNVETSGNTYTITVEFELVSTPGGTACSVSDTQTY